MRTINLTLGPYLIVIPDPLVDIANVHCLSGGGDKLGNLRQRRVAQLVDGWPGDIGRLVFAAQLKEHCETIAHLLLQLAILLIAI